MLTKAIGPMLPNAQPAPIAEAQAPAPAQTQADAGQPKTIAQAPLTQSEASSSSSAAATRYGRFPAAFMARARSLYDDLCCQPGPDRQSEHIQPGQIFGVPKDAMPDDEAEKIHRKQMKMG